VATYRHPALGSFPSQSAHGYGDDVFTSMMWLKVVSVYAVLRTGHDVLFQDADLVWWRDPRLPIERKIEDSMLHKRYVDLN
jgi:hypothetical protein